MTLMTILNILLDAVQDPSFMAKFGAGIGAGLGVLGAGLGIGKILGGQLALHTDKALHQRLVLLEHLVVALGHRTRHDHRRSPRGRCRLLRSGMLSVGNRCLMRLWRIAGYAPRCKKQFNKNGILPRCGWQRAEYLFFTNC